MKLSHLTLYTGQRSVSELGQVPAEQLVQLVPMVRSGHGELDSCSFSFPDGLSLDKGLAGFAIGHPSARATSDPAGDDGDPVVHCLLCWSPAMHVAVWPELLAAMPAGMLVPEPAVPWLAITFYPLGLIAMTLREPRLLTRMVMVERAIAWAALLVLGLAPPGPEAA